MGFNSKDYRMWTPYKSSGIFPGDGQITTAGEAGAVMGVLAYVDDASMLVELENGVGGDVLVSFNVDFTQVVIEPVVIMFPFPGILFDKDIYLDITSTASNIVVIVFYYD